MIEIEKNEKVVFRGNKAGAILFLKQNGLDYRDDDIPLLILEHLSSNIGYSVYGFQLQACYDSWKIFNDCKELFDILSSTSMSGITMEILVEMIKDVGYELRVL